MSRPVTSVDVTATGVHEFATEASDLGIGFSWPKEIETTIGNGQPFVRETVGDVAVYRQRWGCVRLRIFND